MSNTSNTPADSPEISADDTNLIADLKLSKQSEQVIDLIESKKLNRHAGYSIETLTDNLKHFELKLQGQRVSPDNKTAGLIGVVEQTYQSTAFADMDVNDPANKSKVDKVNAEFQETIKAVYDDPIANPLHRVSGGHYDIDKAKKQMSIGRPANSNTFSRHILIKNQLLVLEAVSAMPEHLQQLVVQGIRQAADDGTQSQTFAGQKTNTVHFVKSGVESTLRSYDTFNRAVGYKDIAGGQEQAFDRAMYDAKGARMFEGNKDNNKLASNQAPAQITIKSADSYTAMMVDGLNAETQNLHKAYGQPHTFDGDIDLKNQALNMLDNVATFNEYLDERRADDNRDRLEGREINQLHNQTKDLVDNVSDLAKELPFRDLEVTREADRTKEDMNANDKIFQRAEQETTYKEAQEATNTTVRSIPRSLAVRNP